MIRLTEKPEEEEEALAEFREKVIDWFRANGISYPWRETRDPYAILVSELMLQQTRIATVLERGYYERWMARFPDWESLAGAREEDVLKAWEGLGYYNRARNLQKAALEVVSRHGGRCPESREEILALPGVGRYTAGALLGFAFGKRAPIVDGNVVRVLARVSGYRQGVDTTRGSKEIWALAERLTPESGVRDYNSGIMEIGQTLCLKSNPSCGACPVSELCSARKNGWIDEIPRKTKNTRITDTVEHVALILQDRSKAGSAPVFDPGRVWLTPESGGRRQGLWKLPALAPQRAEDDEEVLRFRYAITRYRVDLRVHYVPEHSRSASELTSSEGAWFALVEPGSWPPLGAPYKKALLKFLENGEDSLPGL